MNHHLRQLASLDFLVVTGKGGVGKSTLAATLARAIASDSRRVLVMEVDPRENLHQLLGGPPSGGEILDLGGGLSLQHLKPRVVVDQVIEERVRLGPVVRRLQRSAVYQAFVDGAPGLTELAVLEHARRQTEGERFDLVVLDAPATGHGVSLLQAPSLVAEAVGDGPFGEIAATIAEFAGERSKTGIAVVTQAEEMPVEEALELAGTLRRRLGRPADLLVVNGLHPAAPTEEGASGLPDELVSLWRRRAALEERELARLERRWPEANGAGEDSEFDPILLPLLPLDRGPELVNRLVACLEEGCP
jgi:anion-transporting  ArsA/GET3 family ATPase